MGRKRRRIKSKWRKLSERKALKREERRKNKKKKKGSKISYEKYLASQRARVTATLEEVDGVGSPKVHLRKGVKIISNDLELLKTLEEDKKRAEIVRNYLEEKKPWQELKV